MSEIVPHARSLSSDRTREYREPLTSREFGDGFQPIVVRFPSAKGLGTCLGCQDAPCMSLTPEDLSLPEVLRDFPGDPSRDVCPTGAIVWDVTSEFPLVEEDACIGCGLCVARCPYGAISLTSKAVAVVETRDPDRLTVQGQTTSTIVDHPKTKLRGRIGRVGGQASKRMAELVEGLGSHLGTRFVRNLLIECGIDCRSGRPGDTNVRMDGVLATANGHFGAVEVELGGDALESPRELLEDVAVLHSRYGIPLERIDPVSVLTRLPNARSEYYRVIADIEVVLGLRCRTLTVGALLVLLWEAKGVSGFPGDLFLTSPDHTDLLSSMRRHLSLAIPQVPPYPGAYRPFK